MVLNSSERFRAISKTWLRNSSERFRAIPHHPEITNVVSSCFFQTTRLEQNHTYYINFIYSFNIYIIINCVNVLCSLVFCVFLISSSSSQVTMITATIDYDFLTIYLQLGTKPDMITTKSWSWPGWLGIIPTQRSDNRNVVGLNLETKHSLRKK